MALIALLALTPTRLQTLRAAEKIADPALPGWKLAWSDEFTKPGLPDPARWNYEQGFIRNQEAQYYTRGRLENARVENGHLILEARRETWPNPEFQPGATNTARGRRAGPASAEYTSASLITLGRASWTFGRVEVCAKLPGGRGTWPAIWMLGTNMTQVGWPSCGEIDIMEFVGFDPGVVHANIHTKAYNHVQNTGKGSSTKIADASDAFHVYALEWTSSHLHFEVDGHRYFTYANEGTGTDTWPFDRDHYLILNLAIGGAWGGRKGIEESAFPQRFEIDYVRVYQKEP
ncbi:MAG: glycoside hydrolase family 16 protein [Verrucomicrobiales bacterium]|nr:glycoside hydrolase family 16 protein [Verrucomicrobiales bacterium]